ncbi:outer membrane channel protein [compost metagenome]
MRTNLDLLNAEKDYQDAIRALAQARYNFLQARLALAQAAGTLDDQVVEEVNRFF